MRGLLFISMFTTCWIVGCSGEDPFDRPRRQVNPESVDIVVEPLAPTPPPAPPAPTATTPETLAVESAEDPDVVQSEAKVGVGKKGRDYSPGLITTPISAYFSVRERLAFEVQIPSAMNIYKALNDDHAPKTHEEFMDKIIKENRIILPELREGERYVYDPKKEQLMVEHSR